MLETFSPMQQYEAYTDPKKGAPNNIGFVISNKSDKSLPISKFNKIDVTKERFGNCKTSQSSLVTGSDQTSSRQVLSATYGDHVNQNKLINVQEMLK